jgi:hypothetical protein
MPFDVPWSRLIRFVSADDGFIYYGDAVEPHIDTDIGKPKNAACLGAKLIHGNPFTADCKVTDTIVAVKRLLGPLTSNTIPAVRCIGGNYMGHR